MTVALVGYGRMGRAIETVLIERGHTVIARVDPAGAAAAAGAAGAVGPAVVATIAEADLEAADMVIEFAHADGVRANVDRYAEMGMPAVIGTTGWYDQIDKIRSTVEHADIGLLWGANFSVGAYLFGSVARYAARLADRVGAYDVFMHEIHHRTKQDSPSGTAIKLAESLLSELSSKNRLVTERLDRAPESDELHVSSTRGGSVPGTHTVYFDSNADTITVEHAARNRSGFALGAVLGAEWLVTRRGFFDVTTFMNDLLEPN